MHNQMHPGKVVEWGLWSYYVVGQIEKSYHMLKQSFKEAEKQKDQ